MTPVYDPCIPLSVCYTGKNAGLVSREEISYYKNMQRPAKIAVALIAAALVVWVGFSVFVPAGRAPGGEAGEPIKIGFIGPLTGDASSIGTVNRVAVEVAVDEVNAAGGVNGRPLEAIYEDGQCNAKAATNAANKLMNVDGVPVIIGGLCSTETAAFAPAAMQKKVIVFSYGSSAPSLSKLGKYFFRSYPSDAFQGKFGAEYVYNTLKARRVAIVYHVSEWGTGIKDVFEKRLKELGGTVLAVEGAPQEARDYRTILSKIKGIGADLIYAPMYPEGSIVALKQAKELGIAAQFLGADAWDDPKLHKEVRGKGSFLFTAPVNASPADFKAKITARTKGDQVPIGTPNAYDNVKIVARVMAEAGVDGDKLQEGIRKIKYDGVSGHVEFNQNGDMTVANYVVKKIEGGAAREIK